jgi:DNA-binding transcriptional MerR regulator
LGKPATMTPDQAGKDAANTNDVLLEGGQDFIPIGEVARQFGVTLRALRFYEGKGLLSATRAGSTRHYSRGDRARLKLILLGRKVGFSLRDVKQMLDLYDPVGTNARQFRLALDNSEKQLARLQNQRLAIEDAIKELSDMMAMLRHMLAEPPNPPAARS